MDKAYVIALAGNPNCGKTTLFNALTGSHYAVGNWAGVTVERKESICRYDKNIRIVDLPGIYSLSPNSAEEIIARDYIHSGSPDIILNIVDATNLERNLYFTSQLMQSGKPIVIALNMIDALKGNGLEIDTAKLQKLLGVPVVPISASKGTGIKNLVRSCSDALSNPKMNKCTLTRKRIKSIAVQCIKKVGENRQEKRTERLDAIFTHPALAIPIFIMVMFLVFQITFGAFGTMLSDFADNLFNVHFASLAENCLDALNANGFIKGLVIDGIISGVGGVIAFFPQIMLLFLFLSFLEDSGYMARTAFIMDRFFMKLGLSGKSVVPMIMGFGCSVPAIMSVRTLENERDRKLTMLLIPFMSCGAKMPVYAVFAAALFPNNAGTVIFSLYLMGILLAVVSGLIFSRTVLKGDIPPFILELPPYRMPTMKSTFHHMWEKAKDFAVRAGTVLLIASVIIWLLQNLDFHLRMVSDSRDSIIGITGRLIAPIFKPCGFGTWQAAVSLISGFAAKEAVVSTMAILYGAGNSAELISSLSQVFTPLSAYAFLVFVLLYVPCVAAVSALKTELNSNKLTVFSVCYQIAAAWIMSMLIFQIGSLFM